MCGDGVGAREWFHGNEKLDPLMPWVSRVLWPRRRPSTRPSFHPNVFSPERLFARTSWPRRRPPTASFDARDFSGPRDASYLRRTLHLPSRKPPRALARRCGYPGSRRFRFCANHDPRGPGSAQLRVPLRRSPRRATTWKSPCGAGACAAGRESRVEGEVRYFSGS